MSCAAPRNEKIFARFTVETQPIALFYNKTMKLFCFFSGKVLIFAIEKQQN